MPRKQDVERCTIVVEYGLMVYKRNAVGFKLLRKKLRAKERPPDVKSGVCEAVPIEKISVFKSILRIYIVIN